MTRRLALLLTILLGAGCGPVPTPSTTPSVADSALPSPSPTARAGLQGEIAYVAGQDPQIHLLDLATGESRQLTHLRPQDGDPAAEGPMRPVLSCAFGPSGLAWSPDGSQLAFAYGGCAGVVYLVDLEGELTRVADGASPAWTPDGNGLVFAPNGQFCMGVADCNRVPPHPGAWSLQVFDIAGGREPRSLSVDPMVAPAGRPTFSPDGSLIAFSGALPDPSADPEQLGGAYVIGADGSNLRLAARGAWAAGWLPDGRLVIVAEQSGDLHALRLDTGDSETLGGDAGPGAVSPDGSRLLLTTFEPGSGAPRVRMTTLAGAPLAELEGSYAAWAPDSRAVVISVSVGEGAGLVLIGHDGEELGTFVPPNAVNGLGEAAWRPGS